uniref:F-box domain-containing protein n=1 Tax=Moschus moschiferus TaxID=68415 RepID=A0A8C6CN79_MOSMO
MVTYILSFLPLSDQKEASLVSRAWYCAAQNALREVRCLPSPSPFSVVSLQLAHGPAHTSSIHSFLPIYSYILGSGSSTGTLQMNQTQSPPLRNS